MKFICNFCNFEADSHYKFNRHLKTQKHNKKVLSSTMLTQSKHELSIVNSIEAEENICQYCDKHLSCIQALSRHRKTCVIKNNLEKSNSEMKINCEHFQTKNKEMQHEIDTLKLSVKTNETIVKSSMSAIKYAMKHYSNAPPLKLLIDCKGINNDGSEEDFGANIAYYFRHNKLAAFVGDYVVGLCKKLNPEDQSVWVTDVSRLSYIIRNHDIKGATWIVDKKGLCIDELMVQPLIGYVESCVRKYKTSIGLTTENKHDLRTMETNHKHFIECLDVLQYIDDKKINIDVLKYVAPFLMMHRDDITINK